MNKPDYRKKAPPAGQGQLTINIFAMFMSTAAFLFVQQAGILLLNVMFSLNYPRSLGNVTNLFSAVMLIVVLTLLFGFASQVGHGIVRRTQAQHQILIVYNTVVLLILIIQGITVAVMTAPMFIVPNLFIGVAIIYTLYILVTGAPDIFVNHLRKIRKLRK
jgi:hypothetical protein